MPTPLFSATECKTLETFPKDDLGLSEAALMQRAGLAALTLIQRLWPLARTLFIACGPGNNGGDGFVLARLAQEAGLAVTVWFTNDAHKLPPAAAQAFAPLQNQNVPVTTEPHPHLTPFDVIVDALFGIGLKRPLAEPYLTLVQNINATQKPVLALDVPSGLDASTGHILNTAVRATHTLTFLVDKTGLHTAHGPDTAGQVHLADLDIPPHLLAKLKPTHFLLNLAEAQHALQPRRHNSHKNDFGHVAVLGGNTGYWGAAALAGQAALRAGAGVVSVFTKPQHAAFVPIRQPELMARGVDVAADLKPLRDHATVLALGPGLGTDEWAESLWRECVGYPLPIVLDADALRLLTRYPLKRKNWILTPHPGEAGELLGLTSKAVQADRFTAVRTIQKKFGGVVVLKGCGTLICDEAQTVFVCPYGNPYMATAGMGDALTGLIAGLLAQGLGLAPAAKLGVCLHAWTADGLRSQKTKIVLASDVIETLSLSQTQAIPMR